MKEYERLTIYDKDGEVEIRCDKCEFDNQGSFCNSSDCNRRVSIRLAELEDKIENGTLIKLPCVRKCETCYQVIYEDIETKQLTYIAYRLNEFKRAVAKLKEIKGGI